MDVVTIYVRRLRLNWIKDQCVLMRVIYYQLSRYSIHCTEMLTPTITKQKCILVCRIHKFPPLRSFNSCQRGAPHPHPHLHMIMQNLALSRLLPWGCDSHSAAKVCLETPQLLTFKVNKQTKSFQNYALLALLCCHNAFIAELGSFKFLIPTQ